MPSTSYYVLVTFHTKSHDHYHAWTAIQQKRTPPSRPQQNQYTGLFKTVALRRRRGPLYRAYYHYYSECEIIIMDCLLLLLLLSLVTLVVIMPVFARPVAAAAAAAVGAAAAAAAQDGQDLRQRRSLATRGCCCSTGTAVVTQSWQTAAPQSSQGGAKMTRQAGQAVVWHVAQVVMKDGALLQLVPLLSSSSSSWLLFWLRWPLPEAEEQSPQYMAEQWGQVVTTATAIVTMQVWQKVTS
jgi:hypothetical protein